MDFEESAPIPFDATAVDVQSALEDLAGIGAGNVQVVGVGTLAEPFAVRFIGTLEATDVGILVAVYVDLTSYALLPSAVVSAQTEGVNGDNETFEILIQSRDDEAPLDDASGRLLFSWGVWNPPPGSSATDPRLSEPISWDASVEDFEEAIEAIPRVVSANGLVAVTEVESTSQIRRLRVEFLGGLSNRDIVDAMVFNDLASEPIKDENGLEANVLGSTIVSGAQGTTDEVQVVELQNVQGGLVRIGESTDPEAGWFAFDADGAAVQAAMEQTDIGSGNVEVSGLAGGPWTVTFQGSLAGKNLSLLDVDLSETEFGEVLVQVVRDGAFAFDASSDAYECKPNGHFRVFRSGSTQENLTVGYSVLVNAGAEDSATPGVDYRALIGTLTILAGQSSADIVIRAIDDLSVEDAENIQIVLADPLTSGTPLYRLGPSQAGTLQIIDDDFDGERPSVSITDTESTNEDSPLEPGYFRVTRSLADSSALIVRYRIDSSSTAANNDYQPLTGVVTIPASEVSADILVVPLDDWRVEGAEELTITILSTNQPIYTISGGASTINILDDGIAAPDLPLISIVVRQDAWESGADGYFRLLRTGSTTESLTVDYAINWLSGFAEIDVDFEYTPGTSSGSLTAGSVTFAANSSTVDIPIVAIDDFEDEANEAVNLWIVAGEDYEPGSIYSGHLFIRDDDGAAAGPRLSALGLTVDTGTSSIDRKTLDPRLSGTVVGDFGDGYARVEFDHGDETAPDFVADDYIDVLTTAGNFTYDPRTIDEDFADTWGYKTINVRVVAYDDNDEVLGFTVWKPFVFELIDDPTLGEIRVHDFRLERDTGLSGTDQLTSLPAVVGNVIGNFDGGSARIEFDHYGDFATDPTVDGSVIVTSSGAAFRYDPAAEDESLAELTGSFDLHYRVVTIDDEENETLGEWNEFAMTLELLPASELTIVGLNLQAPNDEILTGIPMVFGSVGGVANRPIDRSTLAMAYPARRLRTPVSRKWKSIWTTTR